MHLSNVSLYLLPYCNVRGHVEVFDAHTHFLCCMFRKWHNMLWLCGIYWLLVIIIFTYMLCPKGRKPAEYYKWMCLNDNCCRMVQCNMYAIKSESKFLLHTERSDRNKRERGTNECNVNELCLEEFTFFFCLTVVVFKYFCVWAFWLYPVVYQHSTAQVFCLIKWTWFCSVVSARGRLCSLW